MDSLHPKERELARRAGSSTSTVSSFCRTFHFQNFPEFKRKLAAELAGQDAPTQYQDIVAGNSLPDIVSAITANHLRSLNPLAALADIRLFTSSAEAGMRRGDMASRMAALHVVDILFTGLVSEHFDPYVPRLEQSFQTVLKYTGKEERNLA